LKDLKNSMTRLPSLAFHRIKTDLKLAHHILWKLAPVATTNLLDCGIIDPCFNRSLERAAVSSFEDYKEKRRGASSGETRNESKASDVVGRRKRQLQIPNVTCPKKILKAGSFEPSTNSQKSCEGATDNDYFFEYQRINGYRLKPQHHGAENDGDTSACEELEILRTHIVPAAAALYLRRMSHNCSDKKTHILKKVIEDLEMRETAGLMLDVDIWATVQRGSGARHPDHIHEGAIVSGVFYANVPRGSAPLALRRPQLSAVRTENIATRSDNENRIISNKHSNPLEEMTGFELLNDQGDMLFHPKEGQIIIFPPWLYHGVPSVEDNIIQRNSNDATSGERVSFAFNITCIRSWDGITNLTRISSEQS